MNKNELFLEQLGQKKQKNDKPKIFGQIVIRCFFLFVFFSVCHTEGFAQVGINTTNPNATLDVKSSPDELFAIDGIIVPRLTRDQLMKKSGLYASNQIGTVIYIESLGTQVPNTGDQTSKINNIGLYYFDGEFWVPLITSLASPNFIHASNGLTLDYENLKLGGALVEPTTISDITDKNKLSFSASGVDAININANTLSVDATNSRIGVGTNAPSTSLDIEGTMRLSPNYGVKENIPSRTSADYRPIYGDMTTGKIVYSPTGFSSTVGGYRPGSNYVVKKLPIYNTIVRIRFAIYIDASSEEFNSVSESYVYGDLAIVGTSSANPIIFVEKNIRNYAGKPLTLVTDTPTKISWSIGEKQGVTELSLDQVTGEFKIHSFNAVTGRESPLLSYFFDFLGGI